MKSFIETNPQILNGKPVISGTRVPLSRVLYLLAHGYSLSKVHKEYPFISEETLKAVMVELGEKFERKGYATKALS